MPANMVIGYRDLKTSIFGLTPRPCVIPATWDSTPGDGPIRMIVLSPFAKGNGYANFIHYTHGSTLRTFEQVFRVSPLLNAPPKQLKC
jgi:hypothetical protein